MPIILSGNIFKIRSEKTSEVVGLRKGSSKSVILVISLIPTPTFKII